MASEYFDRDPKMGKKEMFYKHVLSLHQGGGMSSLGLVEAKNKENIFNFKFSFWRLFFEVFANFS